MRYSRKQNIKIFELFCEQELDKGRVFSPCLFQEEICLNQKWPDTQNAGSVARKGLLKYVLES